MLTQVTDLGRIKFGKPYSFKYILKNNGTKEVKINTLTVGCTSCTKASAAANKLGPTEETTINVVFTPGTLGKNRKSINVAYDDSSLKLEFIADVES